jgi:hypothetical protein
MEQSGEGGASLRACGRADGAERGGRVRPTGGLRPTASARTCNRSRHRRQKAAPLTEQSEEGGADNFGRRSRAGREGPTCGRTSADGLREDFGRWPMGGLRPVASEIQKSYRDSSPRRLTCEERRKGALRVGRETERSGPELFFEPNDSIQGIFFFMEPLRSIFFFEPNTIKIKMKRLRLNPKGTLKKS